MFLSLAEKSMNTMGFSARVAKERKAVQLILAEEVANLVKASILNEKMTPKVVGRELEFHVFHRFYLHLSTGKSRPMSGQSTRRYQIYSPGKCLLTGGYLILERGHQGLSIALTARLRTEVLSSSIEEDKCIISITSPELEGNWVYELSPDETLTAVKYIVVYSDHGVGNRSRIHSYITPFATF